MQGLISARQTYILAIGLLTGTSTLVPVAAPAGADRWLAILLAAGVALGYVRIWQALVEQAAVPAFLPPVGTDPAQPGPTTPDGIWSSLAGPVTGRLLASVYLLFFIHLEAMTLHEITTIIGTVPLPRTPRPILSVLFLGLAVWAASQEIEGVARLAEVVIPLSFAASAIVLVLSFLTPHLVEIDRLLPVLDHGWRPLAQGLFSALAFPLGELVTLLPFAASYRHPQRWEGSVVRAIGLVGLLLIGLSIRNVGVLGVEEVSRLPFPGLVAVELVQIGHFIERIEALALFVWVNGSFVKLTVGLLAAQRSLLEMLGIPLSSPQPVSSRLLIALAFTVGALSTGLYKTVMDATHFLSEAYPLYALLFELVIPAVLLATLFRRRRQPVRADQPQPTSRGGDGPGAQ
ncbi:MAG: endospore germination permease [Limnochordaceae bacterium]|nr:endospore germination permease [Limnochordaceae bacterium]